jgi:hypothetical protein
MLRNKPVGNRQQTELVSCSTNLWPWWWMKYVPAKFRLATALRAVTSRKTVLCTVTPWQFQICDFWLEHLSILQIIDYVESRLSWEPNSSTSSQEIPRILWNPKVRLPVHKSPSLIFNFGKINPVWNLLSYWFNTIFNIVLPSTYI